MRWGKFRLLYLVSGAFVCLCLENEIGLEKEFHNERLEFCV